MDNYSKVLTFFMENNIMLTQEQLTALKEGFLSNLLNKKSNSNSKKYNQEGKSKTFKDYFETEDDCTNFEIELSELLINYFKKKDIVKYANSIIKKLDLQDIAKVDSEYYSDLNIFGSDSEINIDIINLDIFKYANKNKLDARTTEATNHMMNITNKLASELNSNIEDFDFKFKADFGDWDDYSICIYISLEQGYNFWKNNK